VLYALIIAALASVLCVCVFAFSYYSPDCYYFRSWCMFISLSSFSLGEDCWSCCKLWD